MELADKEWSPYVYPSRIAIALLAFVGGAVLGMCVFATLSDARSPSPRDLSPELRKDIPILYRSWKSGDVEKSVSLNVLGRNHRVDVVADYREAVFGFSDDTRDVDDVYIRSVGRYYVYAVWVDGDMCLFVTISKPYYSALRSL